MKFLALPIVKDRIAFYCHSTLPTSSKISKAIEWSSRKWNELGESQPNSWKKRIHNKGDEILKQLDHNEVFLKEIPTKEHLESPIEKAVLVHHANLSTEVIEQELTRLVKERIPYHKKYMRYSAYWVPVACTFAVVPLIPNIPLAYNLFRLYSHYKAYKGAQHLNELLQDKRLELSIIQDIPIGTLDSITTLEFPDSLVKQCKSSSNVRHQDFGEDIPGALSKKVIQEVSVRFPELPNLDAEFLRAREQILYSIFIEKFRK
ncbi:hypothetical protein DM01DRAFT_1118657 [Hesseltinella vesiculosa]|uniref:Mitochondrial K+-H+ exchange-related-domain-containing protein n=1 Tax=Hesseltinella vesiculosa TaxID=101127 RepID=A0A1X2GTH0_9FUNG|nr:hypothetical protein DM01DRAFT_1118657 [Hesseltinella vesiculosa]